MVTGPVKPPSLHVSTPRSLSLALLGIAAAFMVAGAWLLSLASPVADLQLGHLAALLLIWSISWGGAVCWLDRRLQTYDYLLVPLVALLTGWGLLLQARLATWSLARQLVWLVMGCAGMCAVAGVPSLARWLRRYRYTLLTVGLMLLGATLLFGVNPSGYGQRLWLGAFGVFFQPSEPLKLLLVIYLAAYLSDRRALILERSPSGKALWLVGVGPMAAMFGIAFVLLGWQQDLGAALLFYMTFVAMLFLAVGQVWPVAVSLILFVPVAVAGYLLSSRVMLRVSIWLNPWAPEQADRAFQILQSLFAIAAGRLVGQGLGYGVPQVIPAVHTDFVYAALLEEFGLLGGIAVLTLIAMVVVRGLYLARRSVAPFDSLLAGGIAALIGIQTWMIVGGNIKLIPITGVTLPFLSYGGSSLVTVLLMIGLLLNLSAPHPAPMTLALPGPASPPVHHSARRLGVGLLLLIASLAVYTGVWSAWRSAELRQLLTNPRFVLSEARIRRGQILDRNGAVLADTIRDARGYVERSYPIPEAAPVVGYVTLGYGSSGIEAVCAPRLRGAVDRDEWRMLWDELTHTDPVGRNVRLTLDARLQQTAQAMLDREVGAAILVDARTGELLVLASSPTFDPAQVASQWATLVTSEQSPLLNRATQGLAQPGATLENILVALALTEDYSLPLDTEITAPIQINGVTLACAQPPSTQDWAGALRGGCPSPFAHLGQQIGLEQLSMTFEAWGLTSAPSLELPTVGPIWPPEASDAAAEALGQGKLLVTPLQMASVVATLGNDGQRLPLRLLLEPQAGCQSPNMPASQQVIAPSVAEQIRSMWVPFGDQAIGHLARALAGPERVQTWFLGLNSPVIPRYAVVVMLDNTADLSLPVRIGTQLLKQAGAP